MSTCIGLEIDVCDSTVYVYWSGDWCMWLRESHAVILRDRVVPASQVPFPGEPSGEPGNGTRRAGTTLYRRNDSVGFFFSPVTIKLLQRIRTKTSFDQFCIRFIRIYHLLWSSARMRNELLTNHRRDIKTQGEGRWTRQGWIYPMFDVIRHIFIIPLQNQRNSKGENQLSMCIDLEIDVCDSTVYVYWSGDWCMWFNCLCVLI